jgi:hypothetical protein
MSAQFTYENYFTPNLGKFIKVTLNEFRRKKLATEIGGRIKARELSKGRKLFDDEIKNYKKVYMQTAGDLVLEQYLGLTNVVKYDEIFNERRYSFLNNVLPKNKIDVSTFDYGLFPMVYKKTYRKTIFVCMISKTEFYICGVGTPKTIETFSNTDLLLSSYFKLNGKSAFYGFEHLTPLSPDLGEFVRLIS